MAKKDGETLDPATEIQDILRDGKKKPMNFALLKAKEGVVMKAHPLKSAEVMYRDAKGAGGMPAMSVMGVLNVVGKVMELRALTDDVPRSLPKLAKKYFSTLGVKCKVAILLPSGERLEDGEEEDGEGETEEIAPGIEAPVEEDTSAQRADLEARIADLAPKVETAVAAAAPGAEKLAGDLGLARTAVDEGKLDDAAGLMDGIDAALKALPPAMADPTAAALKADLEKGFAALGADLKRLLDMGQPPVAKKGDQIAAMFGVEIGRDLKKAGAVLSLLGGFLKTELARLPADPGDGSAQMSTEDAPVCEAPPTVEACFAEIGDTYGAFWDEVCEPAPGDMAKAAERDAIAAQQEKLRALYAAGPLDVARVFEIAAEIMRLNTMLKTAQKIADMEKTQPGAATGTREAMAGFDAELGAGTIVTPELEAQLEGDRAAWKADKDQAQTLIDAAAAMPDGPAKVAAMKAAEARMATATTALDAATTKVKAAKGKKLLTDAISFGPLSPVAPRPFSDASAAEFVAAFTREPDLAAFGAETAASSQNPDAVAMGMGMLCDKMDNGFGDATGNMPPEGFDKAAYARNLITGAGAEGGSYMAEAEGYIDSGNHLLANPIPTPNGDSVNGRTRDRSAFMAGAVIDPATGVIDPESPAAQEALGHLRFSPDVIDTPTPSLNAHVTKTCGMLTNPENQQDAQGILDGIDTPEPSGQQLVARAANGKAPGDITAEDAKKQVMASLMTPVHQGDVGSCFATAGVRRMSENDPLESMKRYAELAETGQFQPRNGMDAIPAVTTFPADEDPLIRSMEYSAATVMAGMEGNSRNELLQDGLNTAIDGLIGPVGDHGELGSMLGTDNWQIDAALIRATLVSSFMVEYDATRAAPSGDGSSSKGVYMLVQTRPTKQPIDSQAKFVAALTERVLTAIGEPPDSDKGKEIAAEIASKDYLDALMSGTSAPWNLGGGGMPDEADEVLFGGDKESSSFSDGRGAWENLTGTTQGEMTETVLSDLVSQFKGSGDTAMLPLMNDGIHAFNGLPNHPSLDALKDGDIEDNVAALLTKPGKELAKTTFSAGQAQEVFRSTVATLKKWDRDGARGALMDTAMATPLGDGLSTKATSDAIVKALGPYVEKLSLDQADFWRANEVAAGKVVDDAARDAKKADYVKEFTKSVTNHVAGGMAKAMPLPVFTIADTNWGTAEEDVFFVVAPDPVTGDARMWKQTMPSGTMVPMEEKWVDARWRKVAEDD